MRLAVLLLSGALAAAAIDGTAASLPRSCRRRAALPPSSATPAPSNAPSVDPSIATPPSSPVHTTTISLEDDTAPGPDGTPPATAIPVSVILPGGPGQANVTITGKADGGVDQFLGIPYAEPPTGPLRFSRPEPKKYDGSVLAHAPGPACLQPPGPAAGEYGMSEDCLSLNIMVPSGHGKGLPVMVFLHGGAYTRGTAALYLSPNLVLYGARTNRPFVYVALNYRLGVFGFPNGKDVAKNGAANLGLWDQRAALEWVQANIREFGGDPAKVTVFGQSAGAESIGIHMLDTTQNLFRGAIMQSGAPGLTPTGPTAKLWNEVYDEVAALTRCDDATGGTTPATSTSSASSSLVPPSGITPIEPSPSNATLLPRFTPPSPPPSSSSAAPWQPSKVSTFTCLQALPADALLDASTAVKEQDRFAQAFIWTPSVDGELLPAQPYDAVQDGIARIPFITGTMRDEGTLGVPPSLDSGLGDALDRYYPKHIPESVLEKIKGSYPDDPAAGAPFGSGDETFGLDTTFKQLAAVLTDGKWVTRRRALLRAANRARFYKTWSYEFVAGPKASDAHPPYLGYTHNDDLPYIFGRVSTANYTVGDLSLSETVLNYWVNFAYYLDPNGQVASPSNVNAALSTYWKQHMYPTQPNSMRFSANGTGMVPDNAREEQSKVMYLEDVRKAMGW